MLSTHSYTNTTYTKSSTNTLCTDSEAKCHTQHIYEKMRSQGLKHYTPAMCRHIIFRDTPAIVPNHPAHGHTSCTWRLEHGCSWNELPHPGSPRVTHNIPQYTVPFTCTVREQYERTQAETSSEQPHTQKPQQHMPKVRHSGLFSCIAQDTAQSDAEGRSGPDAQMSCVQRNTRHRL